MDEDRVYYNTNYNVIYPTIEEPEKSDTNIGKIIFLFLDWKNMIMKKLIKELQVYILK